MADNWGKAGGKALVLGAAKQETEGEGEKQIFKDIFGVIKKLTKII